MSVIVGEFSIKARRCYPELPYLHPISRLCAFADKGPICAVGSHLSPARDLNIGASDQDGFVKLSSRVVASDAGKWRMTVFHPKTQQQVDLPIQVKIGNGPDSAHQPFWTVGGNFSVFPCHHRHYGHPSATPPMMHVWIKVGRPNANS
ncbi:hypothetical protein C8J56DRAFT_1043263 [Mycena floridula]|nr:hypothetical protein C8J56DRAFT_1043263 [Mycena floridula]